MGYQENTRRSYDRVAKHYANEFVDELDHKPLDRALLTMLAEEWAGGAGPVADLGSGPGHVAAFLAARGVQTTALDLSGRGGDRPADGRRVRRGGGPRTGAVPGGGSDPAHVRPGSAG